MCRCECDVTSSPPPVSHSMLINLQLTSNLYVAMSYVSNDISNEHDHESDWFHSSLEIGWCFFSPPNAVGFKGK